MVILLFIVSAVVSVFASNRLAVYTDTISKETRIGGMAAGALLLAVATSLPELTASVSAAVIGNAAIVVGNGLGSILFNIFALFVLDLYFHRKKLFPEVNNSHTYTGAVSLIMCTMAGTFLLFDARAQFLNVSWVSVVMIVTYFIGTWFVARQEKTETDIVEKKTNEVGKKPKSPKSLRSSIIWFFFFAFVILASGSGLSLSGDQVARTTGISATAVGSILIALTTSLPDAVGVYTALKLGNSNLAVGAILGSNMFNVFVIPLSDFFYTEGSIWSHAGDQNIIIAIAGFFLTGVVMVVLTRRKAKSHFIYILPSLVAVVTYLSIIVIVLFG